MQFVPIIFLIIISIVAITLVIVAFHLVRVLVQLRKTLRVLHELVDTSQVNVKESLHDMFLQLLTKVELREELIEDLALRSVSTTKKSSKKKGEKRQLFRGL